MKLFSARERLVKLCTEPPSDGIVPSKRFPSSAIDSKFTALPSPSGTAPVNLFPDKTGTCKLSNSVTELGSAPAKAF